MVTKMVPGQLQRPYQLHRADSGAIRFEMVYTGMNNSSECPYIILICKECPHKEIFSININYLTDTVDMTSLQGKFSIDLPQSLKPLKSEQFWLSWQNTEICMGIKNIPQPFLLHTGTPEGNSIGFIKLIVSTEIDWVVKSPSVPIRPLKYKDIEGGKLHWNKIVNNVLPTDALIGGYENEPIYIARAKHRGSLCPGKYVPSKGYAYVPWGFREYEKHDFEVLCGYDAIWMKCKENYVLENAFVAGESEVIGEHLYIGRAMINTDLVVGKVHILYKTCYLSYKGAEVERYTYEMLVKGDGTERGVTINNKCRMNPMKAMQPCI